MIKRLLIALTFAVIAGCTTVHNDQRACTTDCNIGSTGYAGAGATIHNDQQICKDDCNIGTSYAPTTSYYFSSNVRYYPYHVGYRRGPLVMYHY